MPDWSQTDCLPHAGNESTSHDTLLMFYSVWMCLWGFVCVWPELMSALFLCGKLSNLFLFLYLNLFIAVIYLCFCVHSYMWIWVHIPSLEFTMKPKLSLNSWSPPASDPQGMRLYCRHNSHRFHRLSKFGNKSFSLLPLFSAPNPVRNLSVKTQTNSSITLIWDEPDGHDDPVDLTYWVQWSGDDGTDVPIGTANTSVVVDGLAPASTYEFSVWVEKDGIISTMVTLSDSTGERQTPLYPFFLSMGCV